TANLGVVDVPLDLAGRPRRRRQSAIGVDDRVPRVLPALVVQARLGLPLVLDVAVAVAVAEAVDPVQRRPSRALQLAGQGGVARPALVLVQKYQEQRRRVCTAVVGRVRPFAEGGQLAEAQLVEDLARLLLAVVVHRLSLAGGQDTQGGGG